MSNDITSGLIKMQIWHSIADNEEITENNLINGFDKSIE